MKPPSGSDVSPVAFAGGAALVDERNQRIHVCNETAGAMWRLLAQGWSERDVAAALAEHYAMPVKRVADDLAVALADWTEAGLIGDDDISASQLDPAPSDTPAGGDPRRNSYDLPGCAFELSGAEARILDHLEATLEAFRCEGSPPRCHLEIVSEHGVEPFVLREDGAERLRTATTAEMVGAVFQLLLRRVHPGTEWLALIHGAAVRSADGRAVLLPGEGGSGKSTLAAWLARRGFGFIADDMIALDGQGRAVPWPLPHSIKRGSWAALSTAYPELDAISSRIVNGREIKFVSAPQAAWEAAPAPVGAIIFPSYDTRAAPEIARLSPLDAVERLFGGRMWLGERLTRDRIEALLRWLEPIPAYGLTYATLAEAEEQIRSVID